MRDHHMAIVAALAEATVAEALVVIRANIRPAGTDADVLRVSHTGRYRR
jgi:hypothetical protein